jgi:hypothetical protein
LPIAEQDTKQKDGYAANVAERTTAFLASSEFESMIRCLAHQIVHDEFTAGPRRAATSPLAIYLATDTVALRAEAASRLAKAVRRLLPDPTDPAAVEVDYFREDLPPAHYLVWTRPAHAVTDDDWRKLACTTAEWIFMTQGRRVLTVKGVKGGENTLHSSFSMSAAAYGRTEALISLESSAAQGDAGCKCVWQGRAVFGIAK